ncbi:GreA/GreB family elongation factor [Mariniflexile ostreae]|uniref:GreA/GreB family elongation factor n=1 Tax=Mariniflexile ostreae TaxID=1520892 RepID=A0ABV5FCH4_9FLAO
MKYGSLMIEKKEYVYLKRMLNVSGYVGDFETQKSLQKLTEELKLAHILDEKDMPQDVVRFNSVVTIITESGLERKLQVVKPSEKNLLQNRISILTSMGAALFGQSTEDKIKWKFPKGIETISVLHVEQKEPSDMDILI